MFLPTLNNPLSYGAFVSNNSTIFKIHAPKTTHAYLVIFNLPEDDTGVEHEMTKQDNGDFTIELVDAGVGTIYGFRLEGPLNDPNLIIADPYSKAAITQNSMHHVAKSLVIDDTYDWENDTWIKIDPCDLVIYEMHVRDMTAHPTSTANQKGTYAGLVEAGQNGGIEHIQYMGVNAVQILPIQDFSNFEVPFKDNKAPIYNDWNPYGRNHWGYMTTFFFAPESYYASDGTDIPGSWNGRNGRSINEIKDMVKAFHKKDIAVIMDVVYNHVSNYDWHSHHAEDNTGEAVNFFQEMATLYGEYDNVIYEIYNEPLDISWSNILKPYALSVISAIRAIDPDNLIVVGTPEWSQRVDLAAADPITEFSHIAYTLHFYTIYHHQWLRDRASAAMEDGIALFVTEWGLIGYSLVDPEASEWMAWCFDNKISHCNWAVNDKEEEWSILVPGASTTGGWSDDDLTDSGKLARSIIVNWPD